MAQTTHILRPVFTRRLAQRLMQGQVVNVIGREEDGVTRLLEDLMAMEIEGIRMLLVDMNEFQSDFGAFVIGISQALQLPEPAEDLDEWIDVLQAHGGKLCLMLHHFDAIQNSQDPRYGATFFASLNRLFLIPNLSMVLVTRQAFEPRLTDIDQFMSQADFDPDLLKLPPLGYKRFQEELQRAIPLDNWRPTPQAVSLIFSHPQPYPFLVWVLAQLPADAEQAAALIQEDQVRNWREQFDASRGEAHPMPPKSPRGWWPRLRRFFRSAKK